MQARRQIYRQASKPGIRKPPLGKFPQNRGRDWGKQVVSHSCIKRKSHFVRCDASARFNYNWNRYYDPTTAKYITSDPVGLEAGINTYGYVSQNPGVYYDDDGKARKGGGQGKGERGKTANPSGSKNPFKHMKPDPNNSNRVMYKDPQTGKTKSKAKPKGFNAAWKKKQGGYINPNVGRGLLQGAKRVLGGSLGLMWPTEMGDGTYNPTTGQCR